MRRILPKSSFKNGRLPRRARSTGVGYRATLGSVKSKSHKNVTLSLPEPVLRRFRVYAASQYQSMTRLMAAAVRKMIDEDAAAARAKRRFFARIQKAPDRGTHGVIRWTRDELCER